MGDKLLLLLCLFALCITPVLATHTLYPHSALPCVIALFEKKIFVGGSAFYSFKQTKLVRPVRSS